jgi:hypothetical protein
MRLNWFLGRLLVSTTLFAGAALAAISIDGTCEVGTCTSPGLLAGGNSVNLPFSFDYTFVDGDQYLVAGDMSATNQTGGPVSINFSLSMLTYLGNSFSSASAADTLVIDFLQDYQRPSGTGTDTSGVESFSGSFSGLFASASSVEGQLFSTGGTAMLLMGPFFPPNAFASSESNQPFSFAPTTTLDFRTTIVFGLGSNVGATVMIGNSVPEPATWLLLVSGGTLLFAVIQQALVRGGGMRRGRSRP